MIKSIKINYKIIKKVDNSYEILLNKKKIMTPAGNVLKIPTSNMANIILKDVKKDKGNKQVSALKITNTAIDQISKNKKEYISNIVNSIHSDTICFFALDQEGLYKEQKKLWMPLIIWMKKFYKLDIKYSSNLKLVQQNKKDIENLTNLINRYNIFELSALITLIKLTNSLVIPLALFESKISANIAFKLSSLEELYQASLWGKDKEAFDRLDSIKLDIKSVKDYFVAIKD